MKPEHSNEARDTKLEKAIEGARIYLRNATQNYENAPPEQKDLYLISLESAVVALRVLKGPGSFEEKAQKIEILSHKSLGEEGPIGEGFLYDQEPELWWDEEDIKSSLDPNTRITGIRGEDYVKAHHESLPDKAKEKFQQILNGIKKFFQGVWHLLKGNEKKGKEDLKEAGVNLEGAQVSATDESALLQKANKIRKGIIERLKENLRSRFSSNKPNIPIENPRPETPEEKKKNASKRVAEELGRLTSASSPAHYKPSSPTPSEVKKWVREENAPHQHTENKGRSI